PHIRELINRGSINNMLSTAPAESPCAWASFATGLDPAGHGMFGFMGRDPESYTPFSTFTPITIPGQTIRIGDWQFPLWGGESLNYRQGKPFWNYLQEKEIETTIFKVPSNYPPSEMTRGRTLSGMGTPDIFGTHGVFTLYTSDNKESKRNFRDLGKVCYAPFDENDRFTAALEGPVNPLKKETEKTAVSFTVYWDRGHRTARIDIQGKEVLIQEGAMSEWVELDFEFIPLLARIKAVTHFYLLDAGKTFRLYIYPLSIDPADPAQAISSPDDYCRELAKQHGIFYTIGLPADFNAILLNVFTVENYIAQVDSIFKENNKMFDLELERFLGIKRGMLFFYFPSIDFGSHIYWSLRDPGHPMHKPDETLKLGDQVEVLYQRFDKIVGRVIRKLPAHIPLIILSDHGFAPVRRTVNLNALLYQQGLLKSRGDPDYSNDNFLTSDKADLGASKAYAMGLSGIYINLQGRESSGCVAPGDKRRVMQDIKKMLLSFKDPVTGRHPIGNVIITEDNYKGEFLDRGPDLVVGCNRTYGLNYGCALGRIGKQVVMDNLLHWTGDHIIDPRQVPALLMSNFRISTRDLPMIWDVAPTILKLFGIPRPVAMRGKSLI
ncbi:MAG: alkaline phosphatase family protein, partial [Candidatus Aminicenantes bacterium]